MKKNDCIRNNFSRCNEILSDVNKQNIMEKKIMLFLWEVFGKEKLLVSYFGEKVIVKTCFSNVTVDCNS